jgi:hypothetical protein
MRLENQLGLWYVNGAMLVGAALGDFFLNLWKKPMNSNFSLINWDFILMMQPMLLST